MEIIEGIEKTIYEHLRKALITRGYLLDITLYNDPVVYDAALDALHTTLELSGLSVIMIKGNTLEEFKYKKIMSYFSIESVEIEGGGIGSAGCTVITDNGNSTYKEEGLPETTVNVSLRVRIVSNSIKVYRLMRTILLEVLGYSKAIPSITDAFTLTGPVFLLLNNGTAELITDFKESVTVFTAMDIWPTQFTLIEASIPRLTELDYDGEAVINIPE